MTDRSGPLSGVTVVVTRARAQASALSSRLESLGATTVPLAMIEIVDPSDGGVALRGALRDIDRYAQIVVTSPNGARRLIAHTQDLDTRMFPPVACVGPSTAEQFRATDMVVNAVPDKAVAEGLLGVLQAPKQPGDRVLLWQAEIARDVLDEGLQEKGWNVDRVAAYRTVDGVVTDQDRAIAAAADVVTFTSSSTVERFVRLAGMESLPPTVASIGPITSATARDLQVVVHVEAAQHTIDGLVDAVVAWARGR